MLGKNTNAILFFHNKYTYTSFYFFLFFFYFLSYDRIKTYKLNIQRTLILKRGQNLPNSIILGTF